jgi:uncharacterized protein (TIGR02099 family)
MSLHLRLRRRLRLHLRRCLEVLLFAVAGCAAIVLILMLGIKIALDRAPHYQAQIKDWVYARTGYHIGFAQVSPAFRWYGPELYFDQLELRSQDDGRVLARAHGGRIGLDIWQLLQNGKLFALRIEIDSPNVSVARLGPAKFALASEIVIGGDETASYDALTLNDFPAGTLVIRRGFVVLQDWNAALPRLDLRDVSLDLTRVSKFFSVNLSARMPSELGGRLSVSGTVRGAGRLPTLEWRGLASASGMWFPGWRELLPEYLTRLDAGTGAFQTLMRGRGATIARADLEFNATGVVAKLADGPNAVMDQVSGSLALTHVADRWTLLGRHLRAVRDGRTDPEAEFDVSWRDNASGMLELAAQASYLRAEALLPLVGLMPQKDIRERLRDLAPTGEWTDMRFSLARRTVDDPWTFDAHAKFRDVGFAPVGRAPGLRGLSGSLAGNEVAGHISIDTQSAVYNWPDQFPEPLPLPTLKTTLYWKRSPEELLIASSDLALRTRDGSLEGRFSWTQPADGGSPVLIMASSIDDANVANARLYFPRLQMAPPALAWLDRAFIAGRVPHGDFVFNGPVRHFPFRDGSGLFLVRFRAEHLTVDYRQDWPRLENLTAFAEFRNEGMSAKISSALAADLKIDSGDVRFADFKTGEMVVHGAAHGDASEALSYLAATPLDAMADQGFSSVQAKGPVKCTLDLFFPFKQFDQRRVLVHVDLDDATLNRKGASLAATEVSGTADLDGAQVVRADMHGRMLGGAFQMTAHVPRSHPARTQLDFRGTLAGEALRSALSLPDRVAITGQTEWHGVLRMAPEPARERSLRLTSSLTGLDVELPRPLSKPAGASMPTSVEVQWPAPNTTQLRVALASVLRGDVTLDWDAGGAKLARAAVSFGGGEPAFGDSQAVNVGGSIEELDLAGWLKLTSGAKTQKPLAGYLRSAKFSVSRIDYLGLSFRDVSLTLAESNGGWRIGLDGPNVVGSISLPGPQDPEAPWDLEFERLKFSVASDTDGGAAAAAGNNPSDPRTLPAIDFHAAELTWDDRQFGDVRATIVKLDDGVSLKELTATSPNYGANATGVWRGDSSQIKGTIRSSDVGETMKQLGFAAVIDAKVGHMDFDMKWAGAPTADDLAAATGHVQIVLDKGQIVGLKPGAGRVLGLASFSELPRRLALDFSDLTDKGFAFDTVHGDFDLHDGSAYTDNVVVKGPAAEIGLIGRVGLKNRDYDQTAVVTGHVSSTLALPAFAAGPVVGGAVLLFTQVFKQPLRGLVRGYYRITGSWDNPTVERIKGADAATATAEAPK